MRKIAIIQARMGSSRLPGKVLMDIAGKPMLWHVVNRVKHAKKLDDVVVATTTLKEDKKILDWASSIGIKSYAGSEKDVLDRYYQAAKKYEADIVVRITADCPLIDPKVIDEIVGFFLNNDFDYASNTIKPTYPDGLDTEVFSFNSLQKAWEEAKLASEREHVTPYIKKNDNLFKTKNFENNVDFSDMRWTVDEKCDLEFIREIYGRLYKNNRIFFMEDVVNLLKKYPEMIINKGIVRDEGYLKSIKQDNMVKS